MECPICYEKTKSKTCCNHSLCMKCYHKLFLKNCPMCRKEDIYMFRKNGIIVQEYERPYLIWKTITFSIKRYIKTKTFKNTLSYVLNNKKLNIYVNKYYGFNFSYVIKDDKYNTVFLSYDEIVSYEIYEKYYNLKSYRFFSNHDPYELLFFNINNNEHRFFILNFKHHKDKIKEHILETNGFYIFSNIII